MMFGLTTVFHPDTPQPLDILALQMLYGANAATNAGDTTYTYAVNPFFFTTIWDAGGTDTIDLSNQSNPCLISLDDGTYSSVGLRDPFAGWSDFAVNWAKQQVGESRFYDGSHNLAIAFDAVIENAIGGSGDDKLLGNEFANALTGR